MYRSNRRPNGIRMMCGCARFSVTEGAVSLAPIGKDRRSQRKAR